MEGFCVLGPPDVYSKRYYLDGASELLVTFVDREVTGTGYDIDLIVEMSEKVGIPVIGSGGVEKAQDILGLLRQVQVSAALSLTRNEVEVPV